MSYNTVVMYHASCMDGFTSAWICSKALPSDTKYIPIQPDDNPFIHLDRIVGFQSYGFDVYVVDVCFSRKVLEELKVATNKLVVLDHHKHREEDCIGLDYCIMDTTRSAASITYDYFHERGLLPDGFEKSNLIKYVEDRDLWRHALPNSIEVNAAYRSYSMDFKTWDEMNAKPIDELVIEGRCINRYRHTLIMQHVIYAREMPFAGYTVKGVPCTAADIISDVHSLINPGMPFSVTWFDDKRGTRVYSLRSREGDPTSIDVGALCKQFGGGGHKHSAGFRLPLY